MNDELKKAIETARRVHEESTYDIGPDAVVVGALIRAVEILAADQSPDARRLIETPTSESRAFPDEPVVRLKAVYRKAETAALYEIGDSVGSGIRAVLTELAKGPVELPTWDEIIREWNGYGDRCATMEAARADRVSLLFSARIAPVLAAKDAEIKRQEQVIRVQNETLAQQDTRAKETISALVAEANRDAEITRTIRVEREQQAKRIAEFEKRLGEQSVEPTKELRDKTIALDESNSFMNDAGVPYSHLTCERVRMLIESRDTACAKLAELTAPVIVDGKTPGQWLHHRLRHSFDSDFVGLCKPWEFLGESTQRAMERIAASVIRAFGGEALRRVRDKVEKIETHFVGVASGARLDLPARDAVRGSIAIIDDELVKLGQSSAPSTTSPTRLLCDSARSVMHYVLLHGGRPETDRWRLIYDATLKLRDEVKKAEGGSTAPIP